MKRPNIARLRELRKNQTDAEKKLWSVLRNRQLAGVKFRRQFSVGRCVLDFYSPEYKLCIEADGGQHYETKGILKDRLRSKQLFTLGIHTIRFTDRDILNHVNEVCGVIWRVVEERRGAILPSPQSSPQGGEEVKGNDG